MASDHQAQTARRGGLWPLKSLTWADVSIIGVMTWTWVARNFWPSCHPVGNGWAGWATLALDLLRGKDCAYWDQHLKLTLNSLKEEVFGWMNVMYVCLDVTVQCLVTFWCFSHGFSHFSSEKAINNHLLFFCQALEVNLAAIFRISLQFSAFYRDFPWSNGIFLVTMAESYLIGSQSFMSLRRMNWRACLGNLFVFTSIVRVVVHVLACVATCVIVRSAILDPSRDFSRRETQLRLYPGFQSAKAA